MSMGDATPEFRDMLATHAAQRVERVIELESERLAGAALRSFLCHVHETCTARIAGLDSRRGFRETIYTEGHG